MNRVKSFIRTCLLGGLIVLLPVGILIAAFRWVFGLIRNLIDPLTTMVLARSDMQELAAVIVGLGIIVVACFVVGLIVRTQIGRFVHEKLEQHVLKIAPGYNLIKETVMQFLGNRPSPFSSVALVRIFGNETMVTAFVTERHENGWFSVFVPTGPNPTSGNIYHLKPQFVHHVDQPVEDVMRSIISCGAGSANLLTSLHQKQAGGR